ncbi:UNVERIFIED_CONTAM: hypothetical protein FKN15_045351 [Acipenser sinensis]
MDISLAWIRDPRTPLWLETEGRKYLGAIHVEMLVDFVHLTSEAQLKGIRGHYPALKGALDAMGRVVDRIHRERWEAEQSQLARAGAPMCSICMEYGHVEANCHDREEDTDTDLEWEELEVQSEAEELLSQRELEEFAVIKSRKREKTALESEERKKDYLARKMHYLVSTEQIAGVFNSPYKLFPDEMEFRLRGAKPLSPKASRSRKHGTEGIVETSAPGTPFTLPQIEHLPPIPKKKQQIAGVFNSPYKLFPDEMEFRLRGAKPLSPKASRSRKHGTEGIVETSAPGTPFTLPQIEHLPPIPKKKQQGPFRDPTEVLLQRYKPLEPTLRVATSIMSVEEAREELKRKEWGCQVNDELFHHFSNANKSRRHEQMLHTSSKFGQIDYGTKHFREENPEKLKGKKSSVSAKILMICKFLFSCI